MKILFYISKINKFKYPFHINTCSHKWHHYFGCLSWVLLRRRREINGGIIVERKLYNKDGKGLSLLWNRFQSAMKLSTWRKSIMDYFIRIIIIEGSSHLVPFSLFSIGWATSWKPPSRLPFYESKLLLARNFQLFAAFVKKARFK